MSLTKSTYRMQKGQVVNVKDFGATGDGTTDDTASIQAAIDYAAGMFNQVSFPPVGVYNPPIVEFPTGSYRLTDTLVVYVGLTLKGQGGIPYTVSHTRLIMDTSGGTVNVDKHILRPTVVFQSVARSNNLTVSIEDLGFWISNPGSTLPGRGGTGWATNGTYGTGGEGSAIYFNEPTIDTRIKRCNFYSMPNAGIFMEGSGTTVINIEVHECEFDTPVVGIRMKDCQPELVVTSSKFFSGTNQIYGDSLSDGNIDVYSSAFDFSARIEINGSTLKGFNFVGNKHGGSGTKLYGIEVDHAAQINITGNSFGLCTGGAMNIVDCDNGVISGNSIVNSGFNASVSSPTTDPAGIRLFGCQDVMVSSNVLTTPDAAAYGAFGIATLDNGGRSSECMIYNNFVSADYTGATYRSQARRFNFSDGDVCANNTTDLYTTAVKRETRVVDSGVMLIEAEDPIYVSSTANVDTELDGLTYAKVTFHASMQSSAASNIFEVLVKRASYTGAWSIADVTKDGTNGAGNGPHAIAASNTITFSISGTSLRAACSIATDPILVSILTVGTKT